MGDACSPKNLNAQLTALEYAEGYKIVGEEAYLEGLTAEERAYYEDAYLQEAGIISHASDFSKSQEAGSSVFDSLRGDAEGAYAIWDEAMYAPVSELAPRMFQKVKSLVDEYIGQAETMDIGEYKKAVGKRIENLQNQMEKAYKADKVNGLKAFGINPREGKFVYEWLEYAKNGDFLKTGAAPDANMRGLSLNFDELVNNVSFMHQNFNVVWTLSNIAPESMRIISDFAPKSPAGVIRGLVDMIAETGGNPFKQVGSLKANGVYETAMPGLEGHSNKGIFAKSINWQKNLAYHLDKATGGDGYTGIAESTFDRHPLDVSFQEMKNDSQLFKLARYSINEGRWNYKRLKNVGKVLSGNATKADYQGAMSYAIHTATKSALFGVKSLVPIGLWSALPKEMKDGISDLDREVSYLDIASKGSEKALGAFGIKGRVDMSSYLQPFNVSLGGRLQSLFGTFDTGVVGTGKTIVDVFEGDFASAAIHGVAAYLTLAGLNGYNSQAGSLLSRIKLDKATNKLGEIGVDEWATNSLTTQRMMGKVADNLKEEFSFDAIKNGVVEGAFGSNYKKTTKASSPY